MTYYFTPPWRLPITDQRAAMFGITGTPTTVFDGKIIDVGGSSTGSTFDSYRPKVEARLAATSPLLMNSTYVMDGDEIIFDTTIEMDYSIPAGSYRLYMLVCQRDLHGHPNMVVSVLPYESFDLTLAGQSTSFQRSFTMQPGWSEPNLTVVLFVQDLDSKEILQATRAKPDYAATVAIASDPPGLAAGWHLVGPGADMTGDGDRLLNLFQAGTYTLTWEDIPHWTSPPQNPMVLTALEDERIDFVGTYSDGPFIHTTDGPVGHAGSSQAVNMIDFDGDGDLDLHVVHDGAPDQLLRNDGGNCVDVSGGLLADAGSGRGAAWADFTGDGILDVFLARHGAPNQLLVGDGLGGFTVPTTVGIGDAGPATAANWVDFNLDGNLDLYVVNHGDPNLLLRSMGDVGGGFYIFTSEAGEVDESGNGNAAGWTDCDLDGRLDLYVVNQFNPNVLYQNTAIGFSNLTGPSGLGDTGKSMGAAWGDYDNDGDFDVYVANEGMADALFRATSAFHFSRVGGANLGDPGNGRGVAWVDLDNDMHLDLYVTRNDQPDLVLMGDGAGGFTRVPVGPVEADGGSHGLACGDLDGDGAADVFVARDGQPNVLFSNDFENDNHWFKIKLTGAGANTQAIGARVVVTAGGVSQSRLVVPGSGWSSTTPLELHFGLGANTQVDRIDIWWPDGTQQTVGPRLADKRLEITQGQQAPSAVGDPAPNLVTALARAYPNPFNPMTSIDFTLDRSGAARLDVFALDGRLVRTLKAGVLAAGPHHAVWDGTDQSGRRVASGTYFYRLTAPGGFVDTGRVVMVK